MQSNIYAPKRLADGKYAKDRRPNPRSAYPVSHAKAAPLAGRSLPTGTHQAKHFPPQRRWGCSTGSTWRSLSSNCGDRFRRDLQIPTALGPTAVPIYGSKNAREISNYLNAIALYLRKGDASRLERFKGKTVSVRGQKVELITDPATLSSLALAGALQFDQLYASFTGGA